MQTTALDRLLEAHRGDEFLLIPPGGNHGDSLIYLGLRKRMAELGVEFQRFGTVRDRTLIGSPGPIPPTGRGPRSILESAITAAFLARYRLFPDFDLVYIHGGGNFNELWSSGVRCFRTAARLFDCDIVVGPQSCLFEEADPTDFFRPIDNHVHFFCRERYSYESMRDAVGHLDNVDVRLSPDTALYLDRDDLFDGPLTAEHVLVALRDDQESIDPPDVDVSSDLPVVREDISVTRDSLAGFVEAVARAERVYTDRLHVAILSTILGKPVTFYPNSYHKSRGVYEYSLSAYDTVTFVDPRRG